MIRARIERISIAALLFALAVPGLADAQEQQEQQPENTQELLQELQQIQQRLGDIERQALEQDEALRERREAMVDLVQDAMVEMNPGVEEKLDRLQALENEFAEARASGDRETLQALAMEAQQLQAEVQQAQTQAMGRDDVAAELESYRDRLTDRMQEIEPETGQLMERMATISEKLSREGGTG